MGGVSALIVSPCITAPPGRCIALHQPEWRRGQGRRSAVFEGRWMSLPLLLLGGVCGPLGAQGRGLDAQRETFFWSADAWRRIVGGAAYPASGCGARALGHVVAADRLLVAAVFERATASSCAAARFAAGIGVVGPHVGPGANRRSPDRRTGSAASAGQAGRGQLARRGTGLHGDPQRVRSGRCDSSRRRPTGGAGLLCRLVRVLQGNGSIHLQRRGCCGAPGHRRAAQSRCDCQHCAHRALLRRYKLFGPPGTLFFDAQGQEIAAARVLGFQNARRFAATLSSAGL